MGSAALTTATTVHAAALTPGVRPCFTNDIPAGYGSWLVLKNAAYRQNPGTDPTEINPPAPGVVLELTAPPSLLISNAIVSGPGGIRQPLVTQSGAFSSFGTNFASESALNTAVPAGAWSVSLQLSLTNGDSFVGFFPYPLASNPPPVPRLSNLEAAQNLAPNAPFNLSWTPWIGSTTNDRISLQVVDASGRSVFSAATDCAGNVTLPTGATSVEIPAGTLRAGTNYTGYLTFGGNLLSTQDPSIQLTERGFHHRTTLFPIRTTGGSGSGDPGTFGNPRVSGTNLIFSLTGTPGATYLVQSSVNFTQWTDETSVTLPPTGQADVTLPLPADGNPRFYRAITIGGGEPPEADPARLSITASGARQITLTVQGTPGATYAVESSTNYLAWLKVGEVAIPAGGTNATIQIPVPEGVDFLVYRAVAASGPPPVAKQPTLVLSRDPAGLKLALSGGDANKTYVIQATDPAWTTWSDTASTVTTDASGNGSITAPLPSAPAGFYRSVLK